MKVKTDFDINDKVWIVLYEGGYRWGVSEEQIVDTVSVFKTGRGQVSIVYGTLGKGTVTESYQDSVFATREEALEEAKERNKRKKDAA